MSMMEISATRMERVKFSLLEHLGTFTLGKTRPEGLHKNSGSTRGEDHSIEGYRWAVDN